MNSLVLSKSESRNINLLKGLSILLVIFIHSDIRGQLSTYPESDTFLGSYMQLFTRILVNNAGPMFFFISGFLFFLRQDTCLNKFKSRFRTLVIPYLIWCLWGFLIPFVLQEILGLDYLFTGTKLKLIGDFSTIDYIRMFFDIREGAPILSTLWFLRDLIILIILTPLLSFLIRKLRIYYVIIITIIFLFFPFWLNGLSSSGSWFFSVGAYCSLNGINIFHFLAKEKGIKVLLSWLLALFVCVGCYIFSFQYIFVQNMFNVVNSIALYYLVYRLSLKYSLNWLFKLSLASFFIYVFHEPFMGYFIKLFFKFFNPHGAFLYILPFIFVVFTIGYSYLAYALLKKIAPAFLNVITGSRSK